MAEEDEPALFYDPYCDFSDNSSNDEVREGGDDDPDEPDDLVYVYDDEW